MRWCEKRKEKNSVVNGDINAVAQVRLTPAVIVDILQVLEWAVANQFMRKERLGCTLAEGLNVNTHVGDFEQINCRVSSRR
jgi:hypothetical protein